MNVLILGGGGREHTFCWKLSQSPLCNQMYVAPGNAGTASIAQNLAIDPMDFKAVKAWVKRANIELVVVGPEAPLVAGIHDYFKESSDMNHVTVIGPEKAAAQLEGSKEFAKKFMQRHNIPTAQYASFTAKTLSEGKAFLEKMQPPYVLKADGLAAGKGVLILDNLSHAQAELESMLLEEKFGSASNKVVIEEFLSGIELSAFVLTDGESALTLPMAKDYKRIGEGDKGLNTGGMGAISPVPFVTPEFEKKINERIIQPTITGLKKDGIPYQGFVFIGLIKVGDDPFVIEYNVRMGDPETEVVLPRVENDLMDLFLAVKSKNLHQKTIKEAQETACTVMAVSWGYPDAYEKGKIIQGLNKKSEAIVFHAGTQLKEKDILTNGGRVLSVTGRGNNMNDALKQSYQRLAEIDFEGMYFRQDIGFDL